MQSLQKAMRALLDLHDSTNEASLIQMVRLLLAHFLKPSSYVKTEAAVSEVLRVSVECVMQCAEFEIIGDSVDVIRHSWLFPLMMKHCGAPSLQRYIATLAPLAKQVRQRLRAVRIERS